MRNLQIKWTDTIYDYNGSQLRNHWIYETTGLLGDSLIAFVGAANVSVDSMVDAEDVRNKAPIYSPQMLHFMGEFFVDSLELGVMYQHFLMAMIYENLLQRKIPNLSRRTNDLFFHGRKLSVSIATKSPVSVLLHAGVNIKTEGTPIPTAGLGELQIEASAFAKESLEAFQSEYLAWQKARCKVYPV